MSGSRKEVHEPKVHYIWSTTFVAQNQWSTVPMEHRVIRCTGFWSTTFGAQNQWSTGLFGAPGKWGTGPNGAQGQPNIFSPTDLYFFHDRKNHIP